MHADLHAHMNRHKHSMCTHMQAHISTCIHVCTIISAHTLIRNKCFKPLRQTETQTPISRSKGPHGLVSPTPPRSHTAQAGWSAPSGEGPAPVHHCVPEFQNFREGFAGLSGWGWGSWLLIQLHRAASGQQQRLLIRRLCPPLTSLRGGGQLRLFGNWCATGGGGCTGGGVLGSCWRLQTLEIA